MLKELIRNKIDIVDSVDNWEEARGYKKRS